ncbi:MAG: LysM peptidoglycan-binding domain-containing protein [Pyrinomonadaceae bacterium]
MGRGAHARAGDTLGSIAKYYGMNWRDLANFNWATTDPEEINEHLRAELGSTKKTADGRNYILDDSDSPGIIYIPKKWSRGGFATEQTHTIRVKRVEPGWELIIPVEMDMDHDPEQDDELCIRSEDGSFERVLAASDAAHVRRDEELRRLFYNFGQVPELTYTVSVKIDEQWCDILHGLKVTADGLTVGGRPFETDVGEIELGTPDEEEWVDEAEEFEYEVMIERKPMIAPNYMITVPSINMKARKLWVATTVGMGCQPTPDITVADDLVRRTQLQNTLRVTKEFSEMDFVVTTESMFGGETEVIVRGIEIDLVGSSVSVREISPLKMSKKNPALRVRPQSVVFKQGDRVTVPKPGAPICQEWWHFQVKETTNDKWVSLLQDLGWTHAGLRAVGYLGSDILEDEDL